MFNRALRLVLVLVLVLPCMVDLAHAVREVSIGYEIGGGAEWKTDTTGTGASIQTTTKRTGTAAGKISGLASGTRAGWGFQFANGNTSQKRIIRTYLYFISFPSAETNIFGSVTSDATLAGTKNVRVTIDNSGVFRLYETTTQIGSASSAQSTGAWIRLEVEIDSTPASGSRVAKARLDGVEFAATTTSTVVAAWRGYIWGGNLSAEAVTGGEYYIDDIGVDTANYPGAGGIVLLIANGTDTDSGWTALGGGADYLEVDELPPDSATSYVWSNTLNDKTTFAMSDTTSEVGASDTVNSVELWCWSRGENAGDLNAEFQLQISTATGGTTQSSSAINRGDNTWKVNGRAANDGRPVLVLADLPGASTTAWSKTSLDAALMGLNLSTIDTSPVDVSWVGLIVDFTATAAAASTFVAPRRRVGMGHRR